MAITRHDMESGSLSGGEKHHEPVVSTGYAGDEGGVHGDQLAAGDSLYAKAQRFVGKFGVEERGIERVPNDERTDRNITKIGTMVRTPHIPYWAQKAKERR